MTTLRTPKKDLEDYINKYGMEALLVFLEDYVHKQLLQLLYVNKADMPDYLIDLYCNLAETSDVYRNRNKDEDQNEPPSVN